MFKFGDGEFFQAPKHKKWKETLHQKASPTRCFSLTKQVKSHTSKMYSQHFEHQLALHQIEKPQKSAGVCNRLNIQIPILFVASGTLY